VFAFFSYKVAYFTGANAITKEDGQNVSSKPIRRINQNGISKAISEMMISH